MFGYPSLLDSDITIPQSTILGKAHMPKPQAAVLIMAAGTGERLGGAMPKQFLPLAGGASALRRTVEIFGGHPRINHVQMIVSVGADGLVEEALGGLRVPSPVIGGSTRQQSVRNGLEALAGPDQPDNVLIHDAARPMVSALVIDQVLNALENHAAAAPALAVADTLAHAANGLIAAPIPRDGLIQVQTPQGFRFADILAAHRDHADAGATDDISLIRLAGGTAAIVEGSPLLHKLTTEADKQMLDRLMSAAPRVGNGYDVHAFGPGCHVTLCGVDIAHDQGLAGHSDADVAMHAVTDAILGAIAAGDIGSHFPPSDPQWKGAASEIFLREALRMTQERGGQLSHVDVTIVCEMPKIGPHRSAMQARMTDILNLPPHSVSVKATTSERLGFTGRKEGIAALATATVLL